MTHVLHSRPVTEAIAENLAHRIERLKILGIEPTLALVRVGARPDDLSYERTAVRRAESLGITTRVFDLPEPLLKKSCFCNCVASMVIPKSMAAYYFVLFQRIWKRSWLAMSLLWRKISTVFRLLLFGAVFTDCG